MSPDKSAMKSKIGAMAALILSAILAIAIPIFACGGFSPPDLLAGGDQSLFAAPVADLHRELERIKVTAPKGIMAVPPGKDDGPFKQNAAADLADLRAALANRLPEERERIVNQYEHVRLLLQRIAERNDTSPEGKTEHLKWVKQLSSLHLPTNLPSEFADYTRGAVAYSSGNIEEARVAWNAVLQRPMNQRTWRSTWAAFMLAKSYMNERPDDAVIWFKRVREIKAEGCADSLGLASSSLGWQAKVELERSNYVAAIDLYLIQMATGDPTAPYSLRDVAAMLFKRNDAKVLSSLAHNSAARKVLTSFLVANGGPSPGRPYDPESPQLIVWLKSIEQAKITNVDDADRLAWTAYQAGDFTRTQRWLERADASSSITMWIQAKLLLRAGKTKQAAEVLSKVCRSFPTDEKWNADLLNGSDGDSEDGYKPASRALGELGSVQFARHNYAQALDCLLRAGYWADAAYVAERALTPNELKSYVDSTWPESIALAQRVEDGERFGVWHVGIGKCLRHLLARRLTRLGRWREAKIYFPTELRPQLDVYISSIRTGHDLKVPIKERAQAFWRAAQIACNDGMDLLATELGPDSAQTGGAFEGARTAENVRPWKGVPATLFPVDDDLQRRLEENVVTPNKRFHYCLKWVRSCLWS